MPAKMIRRQFFRFIAGKLLLKLPVTGRRCYRIVFNINGVAVRGGVPCIGGGGSGVGAGGQQTHGGKKQNDRTHGK